MRALNGMIAVGLTGLLFAGCGASGTSQGLSPTIGSVGTTLPATSLPRTTSRSTTIARNGTPATGRPLEGELVGIDPGHNGLNYTDPSFLARQVFNGRTMEDCNTTGTETPSGYTEAEFNFNVAEYLKADLEREGARVVMTRTNNHGIGPCVNQRSWILNNAHVDVAIDIHADGGPPDGRGFAILEPIADGPNNPVIASSEAFGLDVRASFRAITGMPYSTYDGTGGIKFRDDLAGLNLTRVPKVLIECGNMQNASDAAMLTSASFQKKAARALAVAITRFLS